MFERLDQTPNEAANFFFIATCSNVYRFFLNLVHPRIAIARWSELSFLWKKKTVVFPLHQIFLLSEGN
jgi:hypothetical protein